MHNFCRSWGPPSDRRRLRGLLRRRVSCACRCERLDVALMKVLRRIGLFGSGPLPSARSSGEIPRGPLNSHARTATRFAASCGLVLAPASCRTLPAIGRFRAEDRLWAAQANWTLPSRQASARAARSCAAVEKLSAGRRARPRSPEHGRDRQQQHPPSEAPPTGS